LLGNKGKIIETSALALYSIVSSKLSEWQDINFSRYHDGIAALKWTTKLAKTIVIQSTRYMANICLLIYTFNKLPEIHKNANLIKIMLSIYTLYKYVLEMQNQCKQFLLYIGNLKIAAQKAQLTENRKGATSCAICSENLYNCPKCLSTFHPKCLNGYIATNSGNSRKCPNCNTEFHEIDKIKRLYEEDEKADADATAAVIDKKKRSGKCIVM